MRRNQMMFRQLCSMLLCLSLVLGMLPIYAGTAAAQEAAIVANAGFELDMVDGKVPNWTSVATNGIFAASADRAKSGSRGLYFEDPSDTAVAQIRSDAIKLLPGKYKAKAYVNVVSQSHSIGYQVNYYTDEAGTVAGPASTLINFSATVLGKGSWTEIVVPFEVKSGTKTIRLQFNSGSPSLTKAYFDDVSIEFDGPPPVVPPVEVPGPIQNTGFEADLVNGAIPGWSMDATTAGLLEISTNAAKGGTKSLHLKDSDSSASSPGLRALSTKIAVTPGKGYTVTASVYVVQQTASIVHEVQYFDANNVEITPRPQVLNKNLTLNAWNEIVNKSTAPANAAYARVGFYSGKESLTDAYFDEVTFELTPDEPTNEGPKAPVQNLGFEMDLVNGSIPGWSLVKDTAGLMELSTDKVRSGTRSLHFKDSSTATKMQVTSDPITVTAGTYTARAYVNVVSQSHRIGLEVHFYNDQGTETGAAQSLLFTADQLGTNKWTEMVVPFTVAAGIASVRLVFNSGDVSLTEAYFDDVSIVVEGPVTPPDDVKTELSNPGFEKALEGGKIPDWTVDPTADGGIVELSSSPVNGGASSLHFRDTDTVKGLRLFSNKVAVTGGKSYIGKGNVNVISQSHNIVYEIYFYNSQGAQVGVKLELFGELALGKNKWTEVRVLAGAPADAAYARIALFSGGISLTEAYFDDISLTAVPDEIPLDRSYGEPVDLGNMVHVNLGQAGKIQKNKLGENEIYFHSNGLPGTFTVVDAETGKKKFSQKIPNSEALWAMTIGSDQNVYFAGTGDGVLYRYFPAEKRIETLGPNPSDSWVWDLEATPDGKIYGGTFKDKGTGKVFEYDIATKTFRNYGTVKEGQDYVRGIAVDDQYIYAAMGSTVQLMKIHRVTGAVTEIVVPGYSGTTGVSADVFVVNDKILYSSSTVNLLVLDKNTGAIDATFQYGNMISEPYPANPNLIFYKNGTELFHYDFSTKQSTKRTIPFPLPDTLRVKDMQWLTMQTGEKAGKTVLAIVTQYGEYFLYDPTDNWMEQKELEVSAEPVRIQSLEAGPMDGRLYLGGYQRGLSIYNPFSNKIDLNISSFPQPEGIGFFNGEVYYGTYVGAIMYRFDPKQPYSLNTNPKLEFDIQHQDRPFVMTSGDNKFFVGTVPDYGFLGGSLAVYDDVKKQWKQYDQVVQDQSIIGLAYKDGLLYGGTSVWGGLGSVPTAEEAKMFIWDVANGKKLEEFTLNIPGIDVAPKMIGELSFGPDGLLWGAVDGTIFAMDPATKQIVKSKMIRPSVYNTSKWKPFYLEWAPDGMLYTTLARRLIAIDPETLQYKILVDSFMNDMTVGIDGSIYYAPEAGTKLSRIAVPQTDATLSSISVNGTPLAGFSPGTLTYSVEVPSVANADIQAVPTQSGATVTVSVYADQQKAVILVTAIDKKSKLEYTINLKPETPVDPAATDATLTSISVNGTPLSGFSPGTLTYSVEVPSVANADVQAVPTQSGATVTVSVYADQQKAVILVTAIDKKSKLEYTINLSQQATSNPGPIDPPVGTPPNSNPDTQAVNEESLRRNSQGAVTVEVEKGKKSVLLPIRAAEIVGQQSLVLSNDEIKVDLAPEVLKQLSELAKAQGLQGSEIKFSFDKVSEADRKGLLDKASANTAADIQSAGEVFEFKLSVVGKDGKSINLTVFEKPIKITLKVNASANTALARIYYIEDDGTLEYVGGNVGNGAITADIHHFSKYAVLEIRKSFTDVPTGHWAAGVIQEMAARLIANGVSDNEFAPEKSVTRAEFAALIVRALGLKAAGKNPFADVEGGSWQESPVTAAYEAGIIQGTGEKTFEPNRTISREQMAVMLVRAFEKSTGKKASGSQSASFADQDRASSWAADAINAASKLGLVSGRDNNRFAPQGELTRAEAIQAIANLLNLK